MRCACGGDGCYRCFGEEEPTDVDAETQVVDEPPLELVQKRARRVTLPYGARFARVVIAVR